MSDNSEMGSFGSKDENQDSNQDKKDKKTTTDRYSPYCVDSDTETYDTEALSIMDINDIIGVQTEPLEESTLESEIAALSEIIADTSSEVSRSTKVEDKITKDDKTNFTMDDKKTTEIPEISKKESKDNSGELNGDKIADLVEKTEMQDKVLAAENDDESNINDSTSLHNSLKLIGEAYISEDSQETEPDELHIGKEPKVLFSCKPLVDKQSSIDLVDEVLETITESTVETIYSSSNSASTCKNEKIDKIESEITIRISAESSKKNDVEKTVEIIENKMDKVLENKENKKKEVDDIIEKLKDIDEKIVEKLDDSILKTDEKEEKKNPEIIEKGESSKINDEEKDVEENSKNIDDPIESLETLSSPVINEEPDSDGILDDVTMEIDEDIRDEEIKIPQLLTENEDVISTSETQIEASPKSFNESSGDVETKDIDFTEIEHEKLEDIDDDELMEIDSPMSYQDSNHENKSEENEETASVSNLAVTNSDEKSSTSILKKEKEVSCKIEETKEEEIERNSSELDLISQKESLTETTNIEDVELDNTSLADLTLASEIAELDQDLEKPLEFEENEIPELDIDPLPLSTISDLSENTDETLEKSSIQTPSISEGSVFTAEKNEDEIDEKSISLETFATVEKSQSSESQDMSEETSTQDQFSAILEDNNSQNTQEIVESILNTVDDDLNLILSDQEDIDDPILSALETTENLEQKVEFKNEESIGKKIESAVAGQSSDFLQVLINNPERDAMIVSDKISNDSKEIVKKVEIMENDINFSLKSPQEKNENFIKDDSSSIQESSDDQDDKNIKEKSDDCKILHEDKDINEQEHEIMHVELEGVNCDSEISIDMSPDDKMEIPDELLEDPLADVESNRDISELESAVKFLQESEDQEIDSPINLSPKLIDDVVDNLIETVDMPSEILPSVSKINEERNKTPTEIESIVMDPIAISEAEIISEAAKLENEKKKLTKEIIPEIVKKIISTKEEEKEKPSVSIKNVDIIQKPLVQELLESSVLHESKKPEMTTVNCILTKSAVIPKISILEERLKVPPKIEIPISEPRICETPTTPKTSLLIQRDARTPNHSKILDSPKSREESKITDTPRKDSEKHEIENVGSPRIILKIAKSAIADCAEPRSPKSPKIRSAANSPNPEDSPGQKLGKIKLKLSRSGHPSIISNENEGKDGGQACYIESSSSLSPLGMKIKLSKSGDASIVQSEKFDNPEEKRVDSPLGMKFKLSKSRDTSIVQELKETTKHKMDIHLGSPKRTESPIGMKFKLSKSGDASIIQSDDDIKDSSRSKEKSEISQEIPKRTDSPLGMKIKLFKGGDASIVSSDHGEDPLDNQKRVESPMGMKIKLSKKGGASIIPVDGPSESKEKLELPEIPRRTESPLGMKFKLSKTGDASIIHSEIIDDIHEHRKTDSPIGMKIKLSKTGDASIVLPQSSEGEEIDSKHQKTVDTSVIESMKIKLSKTGHPTIVASDSDLSNQKIKEQSESHFTSGQLDRYQVSLEPIKKSEATSSKRKESALSPIVECKKSKLETTLSHMLPELSIQPVAIRETKSSLIEQKKSSSISRPQMNVISEEISITHIKSPKKKQTNDLSMSEKLQKIITKDSVNLRDECEIMERSDTELLTMNENSNSSQDIMIIDEVAPLRIPDVKVPKKRGRPRRIGLPIPPREPAINLHEDVVIRSDVSRGSSIEPKENERPKRTCRSQKSYAPPKRGRGRGRGKRRMEKLDRSDMINAKKARQEHELSANDEHSSEMMTIDDEINSEVPENSSELYKALRQPLKADRSGISVPLGLKESLSQDDTPISSMLDISRLDKSRSCGIRGKTETGKDDKFGTPDQQNWVAPSSKKTIEVSTVQVMDEETRMSSESFSRSHTPARTISGQGAETIINEESQGSVLSTATTESEKVKVKNRRMEINFDPDEGPFTVDKIAEYEWPADQKGDTFMIQEQISQYLGVKSFKRKYPDLKRRMVDMEERNFLRENTLVSEAMCDMGLTAVGSSEVLDIMCSDFPDQYEEYRKHMREKQIKEHSKKQKELTAAANAEKNRIDLAEMAVQSALSWNMNFNKARKESRKCSLDLQTFTIHVPKKQQKVNENSGISHYPVALIPGQYTDYYREYTSAELRYYPLNTVIYGPMKPNERKFDSQSEGSQSESDSDSSSDDSSCSSSEGTQDTEESQSTMDDVDMELSNQKDKTLKCKMCLKHLNKNNKSEILIQCGTCNGYVHPSCIDLTLDMVPHIQAYAWQCTDCKTCAQCHDPADEDKMLFCDMCDRGYHIYCVGLRRVPQGRWHCQECAICGSCGSRHPGGYNSERNSVAQWQHEYKKGEKNTRVYVSTLCVVCSKLWRKGRYCPHCSRCHTVPRLDLEENLVHCSACDKYLHLDCVENKDLIAGKKKYQCDLCAPNNRQQMVKNVISKVVRG